MFGYQLCYTRCPIGEIGLKIDEIPVSELYYLKHDFIHGLAHCLSDNFSHYSYYS